MRLRSPTLVTRVPLANAMFIFQVECKKAQPKEVMAQQQPRPGRSCD